MMIDLPRFVRAIVAGMLLVFTHVAAADTQPNTGLTPTSIDHARQLRDLAMGGTMAWDIVESLTTEIGPRLAGSEAEARARAWAVRRLRAMGFDNVRVEPFEIEAWTRGQERAALLAPFPQPLEITSLGGSVATPEGGITAELVLFEGIDALKAAAPDSLEGKIAYVSHAMQRSQDGSSYGFFGKLRREGASIAARKGAVAIMIRSIGTSSHRFAHTGQMRYAADVAQIPAAALSNPDADQIERIARRGLPVRVHLEMSPEQLGTVSSGNVIAEITGRERPQEVVIIGGHLDSWDQGTGAIDDGAGVAITTAAAKMILDAGKRPRRTIRLVLWGAEEVGLLGGNAYLERHREDLDKQIIGTESDFGAQRVWQMTAQVSAQGQPVVDLMGELLAPIGIAMGDMDKPGSGPDLTAMVAAGLPSLRLVQNGMDYFDLHHTPDDTLDKIDPIALDQNVAAYVVFSWLAADSTVNFRPE
ncbi:MAG TPA: M20/M25/M40 family metallo-hydrolase [Kineobactrum sp.]